MDTVLNCSSSHEAPIVRYEVIFCRVTLFLFPQELFKKVDPNQCLGAAWSLQKQKGSRVNVAPTVQATVTHFKNVVNLVIFSCLGDMSMDARDRAQYVEQWIKVAEVEHGPLESAPVSGPQPFPLVTQAERLQLSSTWFLGPVSKSHNGSDLLVSTRHLCPTCFILGGPAILLATCETGSQT